MNGSQFEVQVGMKLWGDGKLETDLNKKIKELSKKSVIETQIELNGKDVIKQVTTYVDSVKKKSYEATKYLKKVWGDLGNGVTGYKLVPIDDAVITKVKDLGSALRQVGEISKQSFNADGSLHKNMTILQEDGKVVTKTIDEYKQKLGELKTVEKTFIDGQLVNEIEKVNKTMDLAKITTDRYSKTIDGVKFTFTDVKQEFANGQVTIKRTQEYLDEFGSSIKQTNEYLVQEDGKLELVKEGVVEVSNVMNDAKNKTEGFGNSVKNTNNPLSEFVSTMAKVVKFQIITKIITGFTQSVTESIAIVREFDKELTEFKKVSDLSGESLNSYTRKLGELGSAVARTKTEMVSASANFKKSGFSDEDSAQLAQLAS